MVKHPITHDLIVSQEIADKVKGKVTNITKKYAYFKIKINEYTMSSQRGLRVSHKIVLGAYWQGVWIHQLCIIADAAQYQRHRASKRWCTRRKMNILCNFVSPFIVLDHILWILVIILQNRLRISQTLSKWNLNVKV